MRLRVTNVALCCVSCCAADGGITYDEAVDAAVAKRGEAVVRYGDYQCRDAPLL
jgi:hypothetical protein